MAEVPKIRPNTHNHPEYIRAKIHYNTFRIQHDLNTSGQKCMRIWSLSGRIQKIDSEYIKYVRAKTTPIPGKNYTRPMGRNDPSHITTLPITRGRNVITTLDQLLNMDHYITIYGYYYGTYHIRITYHAMPHAAKQPATSRSSSAPSRSSTRCASSTPTCSRRRSSSSRPTSTTPPFASATCAARASSRRRAASHPSRASSTPRACPTARADATCERWGSDSKGSAGHRGRAGRARMGEGLGFGAHLRSTSDAGEVGTCGPR